MNDGRRTLAVFGSLVILAGVFMPFLSALEDTGYRPRLLVASFIGMHHIEAALEIVLALGALELTRRGRFSLLFLPALLAAAGLLPDGFKMIQHPDAGVHAGWGWAFFIIGPLALLGASLSSLLEPRPVLPAPDEPPAPDPQP